MDILQMGAKLLSDQLGLDVDAATIQSALSGLLGDGQGGIDLGAIATKMASSGQLSSVVSSWLGDGANGGISASSIVDMLGQGSVNDFAGKIGADSGDAAQGLADVLPQIMDGASSGGSLLEAAGGLGGIMGAAKSFLT
jgi:uncharacterized protein YidB (DUF937 family)